MEIVVVVILELEMFVLHLLSSGYDISLTYKAPIKIKVKISKKR